MYTHTYCTNNGYKGDLWLNVHASDHHVTLKCIQYSTGAAPNVQYTQAAYYQTAAYREDPTGQYYYIDSGVVVC